MRYCRNSIHLLFSDTTNAARGVYLIFILISEHPVGSELVPFSWVDILLSNIDLYDLRTINTWANIRRARTVTVSDGITS